MQERIQKIIAASGLMSRRAAEKLIADGKVTVNGRIAELGMKADLSEDDILVSGRPVGRKKSFRYLMLNKPAGVVTTLHDEQGRRSVAELLRGVGARVYPVGRLDMYSEGLLLLTDDGDFANLLMHPSSEIPKTYRLRVKGAAPEERLQSLAKPIEIDGRLTAPAVLSDIRAEGEEARLTVTIHEGRNRQIRRLCERAGLKVLELCRVKEGPVALGSLRSGEWRELTENEVEALRNAAGGKNHETA